MSKSISLRVLDETFAVCQVKTVSTELLKQPFVFIGKTDDELSLVCQEDCVPDDFLAIERGWRGVKIEGVLDFSLVGILAGISNILAEHHISLFAISTFNTDYILIKEEKLQQTVAILGAHESYQIVNA